MDLGQSNKNTLRWILCGWRTSIYTHIPHSLNHKHHICASVTPYCRVLCNQVFDEVVKWIQFGWNEIQKKVLLSIRHPRPLTVCAHEAIKRSQVNDGLQVPISPLSLKSVAATAALSFFLQGVAMEIKKHMLNVWYIRSCFNKRLLSVIFNERKQQVHSIL